MLKKRTFKLFFFFLFLLLGRSETGYSQAEDKENGWLKIIANLEQYYLIIDEDFTNPFLVNLGDSIRVKAGSRNIRLVWQIVDDRTTVVNVEPGETKSSFFYYSNYPAFPRSSYQTIITQTNLVVTTDINSSIYIDGELAGKHQVQTLLNPGKYPLLIKHPEHGSLKKTIIVNSQSVTEIARFNENPSKLSFAAKLLPGAEYISTKRYGKATVTYIGLGALVTNLIIQNNIYSTKNKEFNEWEDLYQKALTSEDAIKFRRSAQKAQNDMDKIGANFNRSLFLTAGLYFFQLWMRFENLEMDIKETQQT